MGGVSTKSGVVALICGLVVVMVSMQSVGAAAPFNGGATTPKPQATSADLKIGFLESVDSLNPFQGLNDPSYLLYGLVYDYLFSFDEDGNYVPNLALSASCDAVCMNWTYQIRQGVTWHDGTPFTVDDVVFSINYNSQSLFHLWAFEPYMNRIVQCSGKYPKQGCGAYSNSPWNVTIYFDRPFVPGESVFVPIIQKAQWQGISPQQAQYSYPNPNPIGTGPFVAASDIYTEYQNQPAQALHLLKNPNYHPVGTHTGPASIDNIYLQQFQDEQTMAIALLRGDIDLAKMTSAGIGTVQNQPNVGWQEGLLSTQYWNEIGIEQSDPGNKNTPLNPARWDVSVRRAMAMSTNKDYIMNTIYQGKGARGDSLMSPITPKWWYDPTSDPGANLTFDIANANALLDAAGYDSYWTDTSTGKQYRMASHDISLSIQTNACLCADPSNVTKLVPMGQHLEFKMDVRLEFPQEQQTANYLQAEWERIGIKLDVQVLAEDALSAEVYGGLTDTYIWYWSGDPDPNYLLSIESGYTLDGWNDNYWNNATYNKLYVEHLAASNMTQRQSVVRAAEKLNYESAVYIIYVFPFGEWAYRTDLWTNWGDWNAHPYRQMDAFWGANPLFFDLQYTGTVTPNQPPVKPVISGTTYRSTFTNVSQQFTATSSDPESTDNLTFKWDWGEGNITVGPQRPASGTVTDTATYSWPVPGNYAVKVSVSDDFNAPLFSDSIYENVTSPPPSLGTITGFVKLASGAAIAGASVSVTPGNYGNDTVSDGSYTIQLPPGTYTVTASAPLHNTSNQSGVVVTASTAKWVNFTLAFTAGWIAGTVVSDADGSPLASIGITVLSGSTSITATSTNASGQYKVSVVGGTYSVRATSSSYVQQTKTGIIVTGGQITTADFRMVAPPPPPGGGLSTLVIAGIGVAVVLVAVAVLAFLLMRRKRAKEAEESKINIPPRS
ncbi:MAG TPA: ABC transporter substrate-binding protein [Thermoplasmata archaeon]|nr:ABC transporter substrate-binding protein [Thermoplasmata archaeon]